MGGGVLMGFGGNKAVVVVFFSLPNLGFGWVVVGCACLW